MAFSTFQGMGTESWVVPDHLGWLENGLVDRKGSAGEPRWLQDIQELVLQVLNVLHREVQSHTHASKEVVILAVVVQRGRQNEHFI